MTGWFVANAWSQPGIDETCTKIPEANVKGKMSGKVMAWAASELGAARPMYAKPQDSQYANSRVMRHAKM